jgi:hypothetical protein
MIGRDCSFLGLLFRINSDEQLEIVIDFLRGTVAFQEERMRRLEELKR